MKKYRLTQKQVAYALRQAEAGIAVEDDYPGNSDIQIKVSKTYLQNLSCISKSAR